LEQESNLRKVERPGDAKVVVVTRQPSVTLGCKEELRTWRVCKKAATMQVHKAPPLSIVMFAHQSRNYLKPVLCFFWYILSSTIIMHLIICAAS
jgi:hypothetical protein